MAYDDDVHELATRYPEGFLALFGLRPRGPYRAESVEVKKTERRVDLVFTPGDPRDPRVYFEWQGWRDPKVERRMLEEVVVHCNQLDSFDDVIAVIVYTRPELRDAALPATIRRGSHVYGAFEPERFVLTEMMPEDLLAAGGDAALIALPLVGPQERVSREAREWFQAVRDRASSEEERAKASDLFLRLLAWRLDRMERADVEQLVTGLEGVVDVSETPLGRFLIERGIERGVERGRVAERRRTILLVLELRLGAAPDWVAARLEQEHDLDRLEALLAGARGVGSEADVAALFEG